MNLIDEQIAIETNAHHEAKARYDKNRLQSDDSFVKNPIQNNLLSYIVPKFAIALEQWLTKKELNTGKGGKWKTLYREMELDSVGMSLAALRVVFTSTMKDDPVFLENLADKVYRAVHTENMYAEFRNYNKQNLDKIERLHWKKLSKKLQHDTKAKRTDQKIRVLRYARSELTNLQETPATETMAAGLALLRLVMELKVVLPKQTDAIKVFKIVKIKRSAGKLGNTIKFTPAVEEYVRASEFRVASILFNQYPMVVPPTPWEGLLGGGYVTPRGQGSMTLIKTRNLKLYKDTDIGPEVLEAINTIQATPWQINKRVYAVMSYCMDKGLDIGELPVLSRDVLVADRLPDEVWNKLSPEEKRAQFIERKNAHAKANAEESKVMAFKLKMSMARRFLKYEKIYFPHNYDFRGRIYPVACAVNPQSDKFGQALLQFAEAEALGETGKKWLAIHGANTYGLDSEPFDVRLQFIEENTDKILDTAEHPLRHRDFWGSTDDPYGFLAFCLEWSDMHKCKDHTQFKSRLPVKLDATSSGLQHYAAIFRDSKGAKATNIVDGERQDIYGMVAQEAGEILRDAVDKEQDVEEKQWKRSFIPNLNRTICKPATMCLPYGISLFGATDALSELKTKGKLDNPHLTEDPEGKRKTRYLAEAIMGGVSKTVNSAVKGMSWLKKVDKAICAASTSQEPRYTTALGFPFYQQYYKSNKKRVRAFFGDVEIRLHANNRTNVIDKRKSNSSIAPNFIHSQDATHLAKVALAAGRRGMKSFSFIHDSFGVHPSRTEEFRDIIRQQFVELYQRDTFGGFIEQLKEQYPQAELPAPPYEEFGDLDIEECSKSSYMFN